MRGRQVAKITQHQPGRGQRDYARPMTSAKAETPPPAKIFGGIGPRKRSQPRVLFYNLSPEAERLIREFDATGHYHNNTEIIPFRPFDGALIEGTLRTRDYLKELELRAVEDPRIRFSRRRQLAFGKFGPEVQVGLKVV